MKGVRRDVVDIREDEQNGMYLVLSCGHGKKVGRRPDRIPDYARCTGCRDRLDVTQEKLRDPQSWMPPEMGGGR